MFAEERPALLPLPLEPFRYYRYGDRTVHPDGCVDVEAAYYGAPPGWIGRHIQVQWDSHCVRLLNPRTGELLREHLRQEVNGVQLGQSAALYCRLSTPTLHESLRLRSEV